MLILSNGKLLIVNLENVNLTKTENLIEDIHWTRIEKEENSANFN